MADQDFRELDPDDLPTLRGHNRGPSLDAPTETGAAVAAPRVDALVATADRWLKERPEIKTAVEAERAQEFDVQLLREHQKLEEQSKTERKPFDDAAARIRTAYNAHLQRLRACRDVIAPLLRAWKLKEQKRLDDERRIRQLAADKAALDAQKAAERAENPTSVSDIIAADDAQAEAEAAARAAAGVPERAIVRSSLVGRASGLTRTWRAEITDINACFGHYRGHQKVVDLLGQLANADARGGARAIPGCRVYEEYR